MRCSATPSENSTGNCWVKLQHSILAETLVIGPIVIAAALQIHKCLLKIHHFLTVEFKTKMYHLKNQVGDYLKGSQKIFRIL